MHDILRLIKTYVFRHSLRVMLITLMALITASSPYVLGFLGKVMVDDVLQVGKGDISEDERESTEPWGGLEADAEEEQDGEEEYEEVGGRRPPTEKKRLLLQLFLAYVAVRLLFIGCQWVYS